MNSKRRGFDDDSSMEILLRLPIKCVIRFQIVSKNWLSFISSNHFRRLHTLRHHNRPPCHIGFDDDASMQILLRLPIKSVIRFQVVSKKWLSLISSDHFRRLHTLRHHKPPAGLIYITQEESLCYFNPMAKPTMIIPLSLNNPGNCVIPPTILSCCNGLVVLLTRGPDFHVYNPMTRQSRKIILPRTDNYFYIISKLHLVFDPSKSPHYKILYLRAEREPTSAHSHTIEVFSSESGSWKVCMEPIKVPSEFCFATSVCCNNKIYGTKRYDEGSLYCIDIDKNVLRFLASPEVGKLRSYIHSIQEWNGYLYYAALYLDDSGRHLACIWKKDKDKDDKWLLKYKDRLPLVQVWFDSVMLSFVAQTSTLLIIVRPGEFMAYSFLDKSCNELLDLDILNMPWEDDYGSMHLFHQTLAPV